MFCSPSTSPSDKQVLGFFFPFRGCCFRMQGGGWGGTDHSFSANTRGNDAAGSGQLCAYSSKQNATRFSKQNWPLRDPRQRGASVGATAPWLLQPLPRGVPPPAMGTIPGTSSPPCCPHRDRTFPQQIDPQQLLRWQSCSCPPCLVLPHTRSQQGPRTRISSPGTL